MRVDFLTNIDWSSPTTIGIGNSNNRHYSYWRLSLLGLVRKKVAIWSIKADAEDVQLTNLCWVCIEHPLKTKKLC